MVAIGVDGRELAAPPLIAQPGVLVPSHHLALWLGERSVIVAVLRNRFAVLAQTGLRYFDVILATRSPRLIRIRRLCSCETGR